MLKRWLHESFPGQWHVPGAVFRHGEFPQDVARRLGHREFGIVINSDFKCHGTIFISDSQGWFLSLVYLVKCKKTLNCMGRWFDIKTLPKTVILYHRKSIIPAAAKAFEKNNESYG